MEFLKKSFLFKRDGKSFYAFSEPLEIVRCRDFENVEDSLVYIEKMVAAGYFAAGFVSYEASKAFDSKFFVKQNKISDYLWFGIYKKVDVIDIDSFLRDEKSDWNPEWKIPLSYEDYEKKIEFIKNRIEQGDIYQLNFTFLMSCFVNEPAFDIFVKHFAGLDSPYCGFVETDEFAVISASPELFFSLENDILISKPMKGTIKRGINAEDDEINKNILAHSIKDQAENVMILDMMRNDFSKISEKSSVKAEKIFEIEKYSRVFQMTSTVKCRTNATISEIFKALFPCASITGAPKIKAMEYISGLETSQRGIYTGAMGYMMPGRKSVFNVSIRTLYIDKKKELGFYGTGGGIVWDSRAEEEYEECMSKALVVSEPEPDFMLLETMLYLPGKGFYLEDYHVKRIVESAKYFSFEFSLEKFIDSLKKFRSDRFLRVRVLFSRNGGLSFENFELVDNPLEKRIKWKVCLADENISSKNRFLYHKTTNRKIYENILSKYKKFDDVILVNEKNEITESCYANVVIQKNGCLYTPHYSCGLLPGTMRQYLLDEKKIQEKIILKNELKDCEKIFLINSVRGFIEVESELML
ncbi:MAG: chorismate-binding protein [Desulfobacteraceae bacterium]|nr:chorismate-binding protein [Desulfobacteraceae bacterium]